MGAHGSPIDKVVLNFDSGNGDITRACFCCDGDPGCHEASKFKARFPKAKPFLFARPSLTKAAQSVLKTQSRHRKAKMPPEGVQRAWTHSIQEGWSFTEAQVQKHVPSRILRMRVRRDRHATNQTRIKKS